MMKIAFSSRMCPQWDLETLVTNASGLGFDGVELNGLRGETHLPLVSEVVDQPGRVRSLLAENNVELVCMAAPAGLASYQQYELERNKAVITEFVELAAKLGCPNVRFSAGKMEGLDNQRGALSRVAEALISLVPLASKYDVTLLVENGGDFPGSQDLWFMVDAADHPSIRCCWHQSRAMSILERATNSIPGLVTKIGLLHVCDATFDHRGAALGYRSLGDGDTEVARQIELLKGLLYDGYIVFEQPITPVASVDDPREMLTAAAAFLRGHIEKEQAVLSAYKADKQAPRMAARA